MSCDLCLFRPFSLQKGQKVKKADVPITSMATTEIISNDINIQQTHIIMASPEPSSWKLLPLLPNAVQLATETSATSLQDLFGHYTNIP